jgi:hypothetical protein
MQWGLRSDTGKHFDPDLAERFFGIEDEIRRIKAYWDTHQQSERDEVHTLGGMLNPSG